MEDIARIIQANQEGHFNYVQAEEDYRLRRSEEDLQPRKRAHLAWSEANEAYKSLEQELSRFTIRSEQKTPDHTGTGGFEDHSLYHCLVCLGFLQSITDGSLLYL